MGLCTRHDCLSVCLSITFVELVLKFWRHVQHAKLGIKFKNMENLSKNGKVAVAVLYPFQLLVTPWLGLKKACTLGFSLSQVNCNVKLVLFLGKISLKIVLSKEVLCPNLTWVSETKKSTIWIEFTTVIRPRLCHLMTLTTIVFMWLNKNFLTADEMQATSLNDVLALIASSITH